MSNKHHLYAHHLPSRCRIGNALFIVPDILRAMEREGIWKYDLFHAGGGKKDFWAYQQYHALEARIWRLEEEESLRFHTYVQWECLSLIHI